MILGIGTDIAHIDRIVETLEAHGTRFVERVFAPEETIYIEKKYQDAKGRAAGYAKRWAAKEACAKALGIGIRDDVFLKDITVMNDHAGKPFLVLRGGAKERLDKITPEGLSPLLHLSLSDDNGMALAFVTISAGKKKDDRPRE